MSAVAEAVLRSVNPADPADVVGEVKVSREDDIRESFDRASKAWLRWRSLTGVARGDSLFAWAEAINTRQHELAGELCREVGKPIGEAKGEVARCVAILRYFAGEAVRAHGAVIPSQFAGATQYSRRSPLGAVGLITPWNFPLAIPIWKAAPALAYGNVAILKPSEFSPVMGSRLAETANVLPDGVFQVIQGGGDVGAAMLDQTGLQGVSFTGSIPTGKRIAITCAERNIRCQTEMGGKNVGIVLADADLDRAASLVASGAMRFAGQKCTATSRVVVVEAVADRFVEKLIEATRALPVQSPMEPTCAVGPVIHGDARERILNSIAKAGSPVYRAEEIPERGSFVPPTIFDHEHPESELAQEEIFGPVLVVIRVRDPEEALHVANATRFGLSAAVYTTNLGHAMAFIDRIEAGMVRVNGDTTGVDPHAPFGGYKWSSSGTREQGPAAIEFYTQTQTIQIQP
ncbi:MAG: Aldehyde dehydrogenase, thermostable [Fimbriimonadaceae bacterium]|nr:Aldehyde dehydrogenase, thermostable [Fimbriimonadaceae bacterium]